jgi:hypothetical protein
MLYKKTGIPGRKNCASVKDAVLMPLSSHNFMLALDVITDCKKL